MKEFPTNCPAPNGTTVVKNIDDDSLDLTNDRDLFFVCAPHKKLEIEIVSSEALDFRFLKDDCPTSDTNQVTGLYKV